MFNRYRVTVLLVLTGLALLSGPGAGSQSAGEDEVLMANRAFYQAFVRADTQLMERLWSKRAAVAVIHPTWPSISGRKEVMQSWRHLMQAPRDLIITEARAFVAGDSAFVTCYEILDGTTVLSATNIFTLEEGQWKLVHHHASATTYEPELGQSI